MASSTTRPTATANPPRVMMLIVTPATSMSVRAAMIDTGMLTAATSVDRRLIRNTKIVMIAKSAPRPPSRTRLSRDSMMKVEKSSIVVTENVAPLWVCSWASLSLTSWTTSTVFASDVFETLRTSDGRAVDLGVARRLDVDE